MTFASILSLIIAFSLYLFGIEEGREVPPITMTLMASAFLVLSVLFMALRYWNKAEDNDVLSEY